MKGNDHTLFSLSVSTSILLNLHEITEKLPNIVYSSETITLIVMGCIVGGVLPDIDNARSHVGRLCYPIPQLIDKTLKLDGKDRWKHRGVVHWYATHIICLILSYIFIPSLCGLFVGCITHSFLDSFNPAGVPILGKIKIRFAKIKSGSKESTILTILLMILTLTIGIYFRFFR